MALSRFQKNQDVCFIILAQVEARRMDQTRVISSHVFLCDLRAGKVVGDGYIGHASADFFWSRCGSSDHARSHSQVSRIENGHRVCDDHTMLRDKALLSIFEAHERAGVACSLCKLD